MSDLLIDLDISRENTPHSVDDENRKELLWNVKAEGLLLGWRDDCKARSKAHDVKGKQNKIKFAVFGIPSIMIPIVFSGISTVAPCNSFAYSIGMMSTGLLTGVSIFFNFGKKEAEHSDFMNKFFELSNEINSELSKPKRFRMACDVYCEKIKQEYNSLCKSSPGL